MSGYDFNKRDDVEYSHSYDYLGGVGLGRAEVAAEEERKSKLGTYDKVPVVPPSSMAERDEVIKIAQLVHGSSNRVSLLERIREAKDKRTSFVWDSSHPNKAYFEWALHCIDREVKGWVSIRPGAVPPLKEPLRRECASPQTINPGDTVSVNNLQKRPELNTKFGKVVGEENGRFLVEFPDIDQMVSVSKSNCTRAEGVVLKRLNAGERFPRGLQVQVANLTSEAGRAMNGRTGYVFEYLPEPGRYTVRLEGDADFKSLKESNLRVCLPLGWEERVDESSGSVYYVKSVSGEVTWKHPLFSVSNKRSQTEAGFINSEEPEEPELPKTDTVSFSREEFLQEEQKRLKLDKKEKAKGMTKDKIVAKLDALRALCDWIPPRDETAPIYIGTPRVLLGNIEAAATETEKTKFLFIALAIMLADYMQLKFNKTQLAELSLRVDELVDNGGAPFDPAIVAWIESGLKIAIPISYTIY